MACGVAGCGASAGGRRHRRYHLDCRCYPHRQHHCNHVYGLLIEVIAFVNSIVLLPLALV